LRSRSGTSSAFAIPSNSARLGTLRPLSTKLMWRCETPMFMDSASWLRPRVSRHWRSSVPRGVLTD
jgi:hypothetical protein